MLDLAPGDRRFASFDWQDYQVVSISSPDDPLFEAAFSKLWNEFGNKGEMEQRPILAQRFRWKPHDWVSGYSFQYEIIVVLKDKEIVAIRDHTAIFCHGSPHAVIVHLSHVLVEPPYRGSGLAGWLRAWPAHLARSGILELSLPKETPITLVAEMEPWSAADPQTSIRLKSYHRAGFLMIDPRAVSYHQPDFRPPEIIDQNGGAQPLPLRLIIRRIGREGQDHIDGLEVNQLISALYHMYGACFRPQDMDVAWKKFHTSCPPANANLKLMPPLERTP